MATPTIEVYKGDDETLNIVVTDSDGDAVDLTGSTIYFTVKRSQTDADADALISVSDSPTGTDATGGISTITLTDEQTEIDEGTYYCDLRIVDSGNLVSTYLVADFVILQNVKRDLP